MKKKIYFIISAVLQIVISIYLILNANNIINSQIESVKQVYSNYSEQYQQSMISTLQNGGNIILIVQSIIILILNAITIKIAINNKILRKKGMLITFSAICFFMSNSIFLSILNIANFIVSICMQRKNPEDYPIKEKKEMPKVEYSKSTLKEKIWGVVLVAVYCSQFILDKLIPENANKYVYLGVIIGYYLCTFIVSIIVFRKRLMNDIKLFKNNAKPYILYVLPRLGIAYLLMIVSNIICLRITKQTTSVNQSAINSLPLWFSIPLAVIWAPIVEECIYRGVIRRFIKNNIAFIVCSAIIFGLIHTVNEVNLLNTLVMAIPYGVLGGAFAYIYAKTENITNNILCHFLQNVLAMGLSVLLTNMIV